MPLLRLREDGEEIAICEAETHIPHPRRWC